MQKYAGLYAKYAEVYLWHILHLYVLPTLLMLIHFNTVLKSYCTFHKHFHNSYDIIGLPYEFI